jgi:hypothetical protein
MAPSSGPRRRLLQRACACGGKKAGECEECKKKHVQRKAAGRQAAPASSLADTDFSGGGVGLPQAARASLEPLFGVSFDRVRVHDDARSHALARDLGARAFTVGQDVHFAAGEFRPDARGGLHLLAHELTHTVQQRGMSQSSGPVDIDTPGSSMERAADASADAVGAGRHASGRPAVAAGPPLLQRKEGEGSATRQVDQYKSVTVTRSLIDQPCKKVAVTRVTPNSRIFRWDEAGGAIRMIYGVCNGKVQLEGGAILDYSDVERAGRDLLKKVGSNPAGANAALQDAINSATVSASGHVSFTVSETLDVTVSGQTTGGVEQQTGQTKVRILVDTAKSKVQVIAEAGAGISQSAVTKEVEKFVRGQLNLGPFGIEIKFVDKSTTPSGGPTSSTQDTTGRVGVDLTKTIDLGCGWTRRGGEDIWNCGLQGTFDRPAPPKKVSCFECDCPPPKPDYTCRTVEKPHEKDVVTQKPGVRRERMLYEYDKAVPLIPGEFDTQVGSISRLLKSGYEVKHIRGYASPEAKRSYNQTLGEKRAKHARGEIGKQMSKDGVQSMLPSPEGIGELLGESSTREGEAYNKELIPELRARLLPLPEEGRLNLLGVDGPRRTDPAQRAQVLADIQAFIDGKDADGKALSQRARWEKVFPHLRRVEVFLERELKMGKEPVEGSDKPSACDDADKAFIDAKLGPIPEGNRLPQEMC